MNGEPDKPREKPEDSEAGDQVARVWLHEGASTIRVNVEIPEEACLVIEVEARSPEGRLLSRQTVAAGAGTGTAAGAGAAEPRSGAALSTLRARAAAWAAALPTWLTGLSLAVYLLIRLIALPDFPIYFFTDEAAQTVLAADLLANHLVGAGGEFLPTYFRNGTQYNLSASVYLQTLPYLMLGKSIWVTRGAAALATLIAAVSVGLTMNRVFKSRFPWLAVLFLSITPAWFLHSRTAFETALAASFYAAFLHCYLMYRSERPRWLYGAVAAAALAFYSYNPMRVVISVTALLLLLSDARYHLRQWKTLLRAALLAALLALPFARFLLLHPDAAAWQMKLLGSYWLTDLPLEQKLARFALEYLRGLDPLYWYLPNNHDLPRHVMLGYGHLLRQTMPLGLLGVFLAARNLRDPRWRALLIAVAAAPSGAALVQVGITRVLGLVIPMALLTALAAQWLIERLESWPRLRAVPRMAFSGAVFLLLIGGNFYMLADALANGPFWFRDYGLTGMQWGARQVFGEVRETLRRDPTTRVTLSPSWANGTDVVARFFFSDPLPFDLGGPTAFFQAQRPIEANHLIVIAADEYAQIPRAHFSQVLVERVLSDPSGQPGFYFLRMQYVENVEQVIAAEEALHRRPQAGQVLIGGETANVAYPSLDIGVISDAFDGRPETLIRSEAINPLALEIHFHQPRRVSGLRLRIGGAETAILARAWPSGTMDAGAVEVEQSFSASPVVRDVEVRFSQPVETARLTISVRNSADGPSGSVHLWDVTIE